MNYFEHCQSVEEAKKHYRQLLKQHHPDHAGGKGEGVTKKIIAQFHAFLNGFMSHSFNSYYEDKEWKPNPEAVTPFQKILRQIINLDCQIEIIGYWIYCFNSKEVKEQLKELGFWFSGKHKAWVYSGKPKKLIAGKETLDEIREKKGSRKSRRRNRKKNTRLKRRFKYHYPSGPAPGIFTFKEFNHVVTSFHRPEIQLFLRTGDRRLFFT
jgi:hypothetical protein